MKNEKITLEKGEEELFFTMENDYTYLIVSNSFVAEGGTYTLRKGEEQLGIVEMRNSYGGPGMMKPDGEMPEGMEAGERPEMPEGMEAGERPEMPEGVAPGERPEMPEGMEPDKMPGGGRGYGQVNLENVVTEFEIKDGGNMFMVVSNRNDFE